MSILYKCVMTATAGTKLSAVTPANGTHTLVVPTRPANVLPPDGSGATTSNNFEIRNNALSCVSGFPDYARVVRSQALGFAEYDLTLTMKGGDSLGDYTQTYILFGFDPTAHYIPNGVYLIVGDGTLSWAFYSPTNTGSDTAPAGGTFTAPAQDAETTLVIEVRAAGITVKQGGVTKLTLDGAGIVTGTNDYFGYWTDSALGHNTGGTPTLDRPYGSSPSSVQIDSLDVGLSVAAPLATDATLFNSSPTLGVSGSGFAFKQPVATGGSGTYSSYTFKVNTSNTIVGATTVTPTYVGALAGLRRYALPYGTLTPNTTYYLFATVTDSLSATADSSSLSFTTAAANYPAGAKVLGIVADSKAQAGYDEVDTFDALLGRADTEYLGFATSGESTVHYTATTENGMTAVTRAIAHGATCIEYLLMTNDGWNGGGGAQVAVATVGTQIASFLTLATPHLPVNVHYVDFYNGDSGAYAQADLNLWAIDMNAEVESVIAADTSGNAFVGSRQNYNYLSHHSAEFGDSLHLTSTGNANKGIRCGRASLRNLGLITATATPSPFSVAVGSSGNAITWTLSGVALDDGTPGHPTATVGTGASITAQTIGTFPTVSATQTVTTTVDASTVGTKTFDFGEVTGTLTVAAAVPDAPVLSVDEIEAQSDGIRITPEAPASNGGSAVIDYQVWHDRNLGAGMVQIANVSAASMATGYLDNHQLTGETVDIKVSCRNAVGTSAFSATRTVTSQGPDHLPRRPGRRGLGSTVGHIQHLQHIQHLG